VPRDSARSGPDARLDVGDRALELAVVGDAARLDLS